MWKPRPHVCGRRRRWSEQAAGVTSYFLNLTKTHAYEPPDSPESRFVAKRVRCARAVLPRWHSRHRSEARRGQLRSICSATQRPISAIRTHNITSAGYICSHRHSQGQRAGRPLAAPGGQQGAAQRAGDLGGMCLKGRACAAARNGLGLADACQGWRQLAGRRGIAETYRSALAQASMDERTQAGRLRKN